MRKENLTNHMKIIGQNLKTLRRERGLTQKDIAAKLGVSFQQVQKYETGQNKLPIENLLCLKQHYGIGFDAFFRGVTMQPIVTIASKAAKAKDAQNIIRKLEKMADTQTKQKIIRVIQILSA